MKKQVLLSIVILVILALAVSACGSIQITKKTSPATAKPAATATVVAPAAGAATKAPLVASPTAVAGSATKAPAAAAAASPTKAPSGATATVTTKGTTAPLMTAVPTAVATKPAAAATSTVVPTAVATKPAAAPTTAAANGADTPAVLEKAQLALMNSTSLRIKTTITSSQGRVSTSIVDYVAPDALHTIADGTELIVIKGIGGWQKDPNGTWIALPKTFDVSETAFLFLDPKQVDSLMKTVDASKFEAAGTETIDGKQMKIYTYVTSTTSGEIVATTTTKIWIGAADGLPYKSESESQSSAAAGEKSKTLIIYEYDPNIRIQSPL